MTFEICNSVGLIDFGQERWFKNDKQKMKTKITYPGVKNNLDETALNL